MGDVPAIEAVGLVKRFGRTEALAGIDLAVSPGSVLGMLGPNGAGKTTAVRVFATLLRPDGGRARIQGADVVSEAGEVRRRIGLTGQYAALDDYLTGRANLVMIGQLARMPYREAKCRADELLERFDLTASASRAVKTYSGGMRRRLDLAAGVIGRPEVLFLDEPTTGLDPRSRLVMWEMLADRIAVLDAGTVIAEGTPDELKAATGGERIEVIVTPGSDLAAATGAMTAYVAGRITADPERLSLAAPVNTHGGLATDVVRALEHAGITADRISFHRPSLDDVFFSLTGHVATAGGEAEDGTDEEGGAAA